MNKNKLEKYSDLQIQIADLEEKRDALKAEIIEYMEKEQADKIDTDFGKFILEKRRKWTYSEYVAIAKEKVKGLEDEEKATGIATYEETPVLKFLHQ